MLRLRLPGGILLAHQAAGLADTAERYSGGYVDVTTRANLQIREIGAAHPIAVLTAIDELGLTSRGAGADNIRNLTGSPTAGIDPQELFDTRPLSRADTNDIGFAALRIGPGRLVVEGTYFRLLLGGLTGHQSFARDAGVLLPDEVVPAAVAILKVFIANGERTDRRRVRLKYLIDRWGIDKLMTEAAVHLPFAWRLAPGGIAEPRGPIDRQGHIGVHKQAQPSLFYIGVVPPVGRLTVAQLRGLAAIAAMHGSGTLRLTVWQNLLISDIPGAAVDAAVTEITALGLTIAANAVRAGLVACTGAAGCRFALADTKASASADTDWKSRRPSRCSAPLPPPTWMW